MWFLNIWGENTKIDTPDFIFSKHYFDNMQPSDTIYDTWKHPYHGGIDIQNFTFSIFHWFRKFWNFIFLFLKKKYSRGFRNRKFHFFYIYHYIIVGWQCFVIQSSWFVFYINFTRRSFLEIWKKSEKHQKMSVGMPCP